MKAIYTYLVYFHYFLQSVALEELSFLSQIEPNGTSNKVD